jgi:hypothetical protein
MTLIIGSGVVALGVLGVVVGGVDKGLDVGGTSGSSAKRLRKYLAKLARTVTTH